MTQIMWQSISSETCQDKIVTSDMTLKQQQKTGEMVKNNERWVKTVTEMRAIPNAVENLHVRSPLQRGPPPKTVPVPVLLVTPRDIACTSI